MAYDKVFIFDLDGTLIDSKYQITECVNEARQYFGFFSADPDELFSKIGLPVESLFADLELSGSAMKEIVNYFRVKLSETISINNKVFPGVLDFLSSARELGIGIGVATSKPNDLAKKVVANSALAELIDYVQGLDNFPGKPDPEVIIRVMHNLPSSSYFMFGDRIEDIEAAKSAKINGVGIAQGFHSEADLSKAGAIKTYSSFAFIDSPRSILLLG